VAFIHDMDEAAISNVAGESSYVRVQVLTPVRVLDRDKQLGVVGELTEIIAAAAGNPSLREPLFESTKGYAVMWPVIGLPVLLAAILLKPRDATLGDENLATAT
jgi:hypothetical protein